jgi:hypothetical protein
MVSWNGATEMDYSKFAPYNSRVATDGAYLRVIGVSPSVGDNLTDAYPAIQSALDTAAISGGIVNIPAGIYRVNTQLEIGSNTELRMAPGAIIRRNNSAMNIILTNKHDGTTGGYGQASKFTIRGGEFDANNTEIAGNVTNVGFGHCSNVDVIGVTFSNNNSAWHLLEINACKDTRVLNNYFTGHINASTYSTESLQIDLALDGGVFPWFGPYDSTPCEGVLIEGNTFTNNSVSAIGSHSKATGFNHSNINIIGNKFNLGTTGYAIKTLNYNDVTINNNIIVGGERGIVVNGSAASEGSRRITIVGNQLRNTQRHAIGFDFCTGVVCNNNVISNAGIGAGVTGVSIYNYFSKEVVIKGNYATGGDVAGAGSQGDITLGGSNTLGTPAGSSEIICAGNVVDTLMVTADLAKAIVTDNVIKTSYLTWGTVGDVQKKSNYIAGSWVA